MERECVNGGEVDSGRSGGGRDARAATSSVEEAAVVVAVEGKGGEGVRGTVNAYKGVRGNVEEGQTRDDL
jgi:hypothetical protein